jgi:hypothetical protein
MDAIDALLKSQDVVAVLGRDVTVQLIDFSLSGCLLESSVRLEVGAHGSLRVAYEGQEFTDDVRVMRCQPCAGSSGLYQVGAEFVWTTPPTDRSLRMLLPRLQGASLKETRLRGLQM